MASISIPAMKSMALINSKIIMGLFERERRYADVLSITPRVDPVQEKIPAKATMNITTADERTASRNISYRTLRDRLLYMNIPTNKP